MLSLRDTKEACLAAIANPEPTGGRTFQLGERILHFVHSSWNFFAVLLFLGKNIPARSCAPEN